MLCLQAVNVFTWAECFVPAITAILRRSGEKKFPKQAVILLSQELEFTIMEKIIQKIYFWSMEILKVWKFFACFCHFSFPPFSAVEVVKLGGAKEKLRASVNTWNTRWEGISWLYKVTWWRSWTLLAPEHKVRWLHVTKTVSEGAWDVWLKPLDPAWDYLKVGLNK